MARSGRREDINQRITLLGGEDVERQLRAIGTTGERTFQALNRSALSSTGHLGSMATATSKAGEVFRNQLGSINAFSRSIGGIGTAIALALPGLRALAGLSFGGAVAGLGALVQGTANSINELKNFATTTGANINSVKALAEAFQDAGVDGALAREALLKIADEMGKAKLSGDALAKTMSGGVSVLRGAGKAAGEAAKGVDVLRGSMKAAADDGFDMFGLAGKGGTTVFRGGRGAVGGPNLEQFQKDPIRALGIDLTTYKTVEEGLEAVLIRLDALKKIDKELAIAAGIEIFGRRFKEMAAGFEHFVRSGNFEGMLAQLREQKRLLSPEDIKRVEDYRRAWDDLGDAFEKAQQTAGLALMPKLTEQFPLIAQDIHNLVGVWDTFKQSLNTFNTDGVKAAFDQLFANPQIAAFFGTGEGGPKLENFGFGRIIAELQNLPVSAEIAFGKVTAALEKLIGTQLNQGDPWGVVSGLAVVQQAFIAMRDNVVPLANQMSDAFSNMWPNFRSAAETAIGWVMGALSALSELVNQIGRAISNIRVPQAQPVATAPIPPASTGGSDSYGYFARGGLIRGPGTGTSDSVPIWGSNGEFMMRMKAVRFWGVDFMRALNAAPGFARGGLIETRGLLSPSSSLMNSRLLGSLAGRAGRMLRSSSGQWMRSEGGTPIYLNLPGGGTVGPMMADRDVAQSVIRVARRSKTLSAGRAPGFVGG